jgi:hypothetical protein
MKNRGAIASFFLFYVRIKVSETRLGIKRKVYEGKSNGEDEIKVSGKNGRAVPHNGRGIYGDY